MSPKITLSAFAMILCLPLVIACGQVKKAPAAKTTSSSLAAATSKPAAKSCQPMVPNRDLANLTAFVICSTVDSSIVKIKYQQNSGLNYCVFPSTGYAAPGSNFCFVTDSSGEINVQWPGTSNTTAYLVEGNQKDTFANALQGLNQYPDYASGSIVF